MSHSKETLIICMAEHLSETLSSRVSAKHLFAEVVHPEKINIFDFSGITFASRSFLDQYIQELERLTISGIQYKEMNIDDSIIAAIKTIKVSRKSQRNLSDSIEIKSVSSLDELEAALT